MIYIISGVILVIGLIIYVTLNRNFFTKYRYTRIVTYNDNMTVDVKYVKNKDFMKDDTLLVNPEHIYDFKGYKSVITTCKSGESINPLDFESKYEAEKFKVGITTKLIKEAFGTLKISKFDKIMFLLVLNVIQLMAIMYLLYNLLG